MGRKIAPHVPLAFIVQQKVSFCLYHARQDMYATLKELWHLNRFVRLGTYAWVEFPQGWTKMQSHVQLLKQLALISHATMALCISKMIHWIQAVKWIHFSEIRLFVVKRKNGWSSGSKTLVKQLEQRKILSTMPINCRKITKKNAKNWLIVEIGDVVYKLKVKKISFYKSNLKILRMSTEWQY